MGCEHQTTQNAGAMIDIVCKFSGMPCGLTDCPKKGDDDSE